MTQYEQTRDALSMSSLIHIFQAFRCRIAYKNGPQPTDKREGTPRGCGGSAGIKAFHKVGNVAGPAQGNNRNAQLSGNRPDQLEIVPDARAVQSFRLKNYFADAGILQPHTKIDRLSTQIA
jgi:hypothetical protein